MKFVDNKEEHFNLEENTSDRHYYVDLKVLTRQELLGFVTKHHGMDTSEMYNTAVFTCVRCRSNGAGDGARNELWRGGCCSCQRASAHPTSPGHLSRQHVPPGNDTLSLCLLPSYFFLSCHTSKPRLLSHWVCFFPVSLHRGSAESRCQRVRPQTGRAAGHQDRGEEHQQCPISGQGYR